MTDAAADRVAPGVVPARLEATVVGRVQGVGYRYHVLRQAMALGLTGWVANEGDGTVRCRAEGLRVDLEALLGALQNGPPGAHVERVIAAWGPGTGRLGPFGIRSGGHRGD
ncbi:MAG: acylphosphatase [Candidatus Limnocylindrales bacterium]